MSETWRAVVGYDEVYEVSDLGRVRRVRGGRGTTAGLVLKPRLNRRGYVVLDLCKAGVSRQQTVHRLVAMAFLGTAPTERHQPNHRDGVKTNNAVGNLEWVTPQENTAHAVRTGLRRSGFRAPPGEANPFAKLTAGNVEEIRRLKGTATLAVIAARFGVSIVTIHDIYAGKTWRQ